jgi:hypothetical protein
MAALVMGAAWVGTMALFGFTVLLLARGFGRL